MHRAMNDFQRARLSRGRMIQLHAYPIPSPHVPISKLDRRPTRKPRKSGYMLTGRSGRGAESYDRKKAWPSKNHSIPCGGGGGVEGEVPTNVHHEGNTEEENYGYIVCK